MKSNVFIPKTLKVGYQKRGDTYSGKLAYIIYIDEKGKVRKETSWNSWRDKGIQPNDYPNEPISGFVLNKKVGGVSCDGWNPRQTYTRVYDPRGFEFEITVPNLLYILENCNSIKGKGLDGEFVYAWSGTELLLLPVDAPDFKNHQAFSDGIYGKKISTKEMIPGATYRFANGDIHIYLGCFPEYNNCSWENEMLKGTMIAKGNFFFFNSQYNKEKDKNGKIKSKWCIGTYASLPKIAQCLDEGSHPDYALMMDCLESDERYKPKIVYELEKTPYTYDEFEKFIAVQISERNFYGNLTVMGQNANGVVIEKRLYTNNYRDYSYTVKAERIFCIGRRGYKGMTLREIFDLIKPVKVIKVKKTIKKGELQNV